MKYFYIDEKYNTKNTICVVLAEENGLKLRIGVGEGRYYDGFVHGLKTAGYTDATQRNDLLTAQEEYERARDWYENLNARCKLAKDRFFETLDNLNSMKAKYEIED